METFGEWLLEKLDEKGWTQSELARRAHITQPTLSRIISETRGVGPDVALKIARALKEPAEIVFQHARLLPSVPRGELDPVVQADLDQIRRYVEMMSPEAQARFTEQLVNLAREFAELGRNESAA